MKEHNIILTDQLIIDRFLGTKSAIDCLLADDERSDALYDDISRKITCLNPQDRVAFVAQILHGLSRDDDEWGLDKRDAAIELLQLVNFEEMSRGHLLLIYTKTVVFQDQTADPYGSIHSLLEAGKIIAPYLFPEEATRKRIDGVWRAVAAFFDGVDRSYINDGRENILSAIPEPSHGIQREIEERQRVKTHDFFKAAVESGAHQSIDSRLATLIEKHFIDNISLNRLTSDAGVNSRERVRQLIA